MPRITEAVSVDDFVIGMCYKLMQRGWKSIKPNERTRDRLDLALHLSFWQAYTFLRDEIDDELLGFRMVLDPTHGESRTLSEAMSFMVMLRFMYTAIPGDGSYIFHYGSAIDAIATKIPIPDDFLVELADRFCLEYSDPRTERSWPDGFEVPAPPIMLALSQ